MLCAIETGTNDGSLIAARAYQRMPLA